MRTTLIAAVVALAASYALPAMAEGDCGWGNGQMTTASDKTNPATTVTADAGAKQAKPDNSKN